MGCIAGALEESEYRAKLPRRGFDAGRGRADARLPRRRTRSEFFAGRGLDIEKIAPLVDGKFMSAFVRARKPPYPR